VQLARPISDETDDIGGIQGAKIDWASTKAMDEEISRACAVIADRACSKPSVAQQELFKASPPIVGGNGCSGKRRTKASISQITEPLAKCGDLVAPWLSLAIASRLIAAAMELVDVRIADFR
jgi:hypothetical protein